MVKGNERRKEGMEKIFSILVVSMLLLSMIFVAPLSQAAAPSPSINNSQSYALSTSRANLCAEPPLNSRAEESTSQSNETEPFKPIVTKPDWVDKDNNSIADTLDQEIADRLANGTAYEYVNVTVEFSLAPTAYDAGAFISCGGFVTTNLWTYATYGFGGTIQYDQIGNFVKQCPAVLLIEKEAECHADIAYAARQIGARTYVWSNLSLQGDPNSALAIIDTGIDASHPDFSPGYGDQDFSKKIVGWNDTVNYQTSPYDDEGHGSHCSGLAAGDGFFSTDTSGNAIATWSANLGTISSSGTYLITGMMVNKSGTITVKVKWYSTGTSKVSALPLYYGDKTLSTGSWTSVASVSTPSANTWYTLTYTVSSTPSGGYNMYHPLLTLTAGTGSLYVVFTVSWPYTPPSDGYSAWTGIAPQTRLVGEKVMDNTGSGTTAEIMGALDGLISKAQTWHVTVASMSLGFSSEVATVDTAVTNLVNAGVTVVVAAGNSGASGTTNYIYTPGSVNEVICVAAMNQFDNIDSFSSAGGSSRQSPSRSTKPDITAPGGSFYGVPLYSVDSNYNDAEGHWTDTQANDAAGEQGTSMATPIVAGAAEIIVQALGGYSSWVYDRTHALLPKMILCMTATETYPNLRESGTTSTSPTLQRASGSGTSRGKDIHEGYGRMNLDAAADAVLYTYGIGTTATATLGTPPTLSNIAVLGQRLAWARNVQLVKGYRYTFTLTVPSGADYDLYLYNNTGNAVSGSYYGDPGIVAYSTTATTGGAEQFTVKAPYTGTYYVVVKRATETTGGGTFTLTSSGPVLVTLNTPGLPSASNVVHYTQNSTLKTGSIASSTFSDYADTGTTISIDNPISISSTERYYTTGTTSFTVTSSATFTVNYSHQYYFTVTSAHDTPTPSSGWFNASTSITESVTSPFAGSTGTQYVCTGWTATGSVPGSGTAASVTFTINTGSSITWGWKTQYYLTVSSAYDTATPSSGWFDNNTFITETVTSPWPGSTGTRYVCTGWSGTGNVPGSGTSTSVGFTMTEPSNITWNWKTQYYLTVTSPYDTSGGTDWYDNGTTAYATLATGIYDIVPGWVRAVFTGWSGDASGTGLTSDPITMNGPKTAVATWKIQYYLKVATDPSTLPSIPGEDWYDNYTWVHLTAYRYFPNATGVSGVRYRFSYWDVDGSSQGAGTNPIDVHMDTYHVATAHFVLQYLVTLNETGLDGTATGTVVTVDSSAKTYLDLPFNEWVDTGTSVSYSYEAIVSSSASGERFRLDSVTGPTSPINVTTPVTVTGNYVLQYYLTVGTSPPGVNSPTGEDWYDSGTYASIATPRDVDIVSGSSRYDFRGWQTADMSEITDPSAPSTTVLMDKAKTVTADYVIQYFVTFGQSGVGSDFTGTVVTIDGPGYDRTGASFWYDSGSTHTFAFQSPLVVPPGAKEYDWTSTSGLSTSQSGSITVTGEGSITGNYVMLVHDVAVTSVVSDRTWVYQGWCIAYSARINVTVQNSGNFSETVKVTLYYNMTANETVGTQTIGLNVGESQTLTFVWNTTGVVFGRNYTITAVATIPHDINPANNVLAGGKIKLRILGDVNDDGKVNLADVFGVALAFGSRVGEPRYNKNLDINNDGKIDLKDYFAVCLNFGKFYLP
jgi:subtilisin family serine protease